MNKLIDKITAQAESLLRGNLQAILSDLETLVKEQGTGEVPITLNISLSKDSIYSYGTEIKWNKAVKHSDETDVETFDPDQPDMFDKPEVPLNKNGKLSENDKIKKTKKIGEFIQSAMPEKED